MFNTPIANSTASNVAQTNRESKINCELLGEVRFYVADLPQYITNLSAYDGKMVGEVCAKES